ncbi:MAG: hypothetical protein DBX58_03365 [Clostridiales bacterium]|nr:MAG: hypothetical protein DBX58_03365 [Clostridiales bacterium]
MTDLVNRAQKSICQFYIRLCQAILRIGTNLTRAAFFAVKIEVIQRDSVLHFRMIILSFIHIDNPKS